MHYCIKNRSQRSAPRHATPRLNNVNVSQHMTPATHLRKSQSVHNLALWRFVDEFRGHINNFIDV